MVQLYDAVDKQDGYASFVVENAYKNEIQAFFDEIEGQFTQEYSFVDDRLVLSLIDQIEKNN